MTQIDRGSERQERENDTDGQRVRTTGREKDTDGQRVRTTGKTEGHR